MKGTIGTVVDYEVKEALERIAKQNKTTVSKYVAKLLKEHVKDEVPQRPKNTVRQYDESEMTEEDFAQFERAQKFDPKLTVQGYLRWKHASAETSF